VGKFPIEHLNGFDGCFGLLAVDRATHRGYARLESKFFAHGQRTLLQKLQSFLAFAAFRKRETLLRGSRWVNCGRSPGEPGPRSAWPVIRMSRANEFAYEMCFIKIKMGQVAACPIVRALR